MWSMVSHKNMQGEVHDRVTAMYPEPKESPIHRSAHRNRNQFCFCVELQELQEIVIPFLRFSVFIQSSSHHCLISSEYVAEWY